MSSAERLAPPHGVNGNSGIRLQQINFIDDVSLAALQLISYLRQRIGIIGWACYLANDCADFASSYVLEDIGESIRFDKPAQYDVIAYPTEMRNQLRGDVNLDGPQKSR